MCFAASVCARYLHTRYRCSSPCATFEAQPAKLVFLTAESRDEISITIISTLCSYLSFLFVRLDFFLYSTLLYPSNRSSYDTQLPREKNLKQRLACLLRTLPDIAFLDIIPHLPWHPRPT